MAANAQSASCSKLLRVSLSGLVYAATVWLTGQHAWGHRAWLGVGQTRVHVHAPRIAHAVKYSVDVLVLNCGSVSVIGEIVQLVCVEVLRVVFQGAHIELQILHPKGIRTRSSLSAYKDGHASVDILMRFRAN